MHFELFVASRYLVARRKGLFAFVTTIIAITGIALGVASLIVTLSVMTGFHDEIQNRILGIQAHVIVAASTQAGISLKQYPSIAEKISSIREIRAIAPFIYGQVVIKKGKSTAGIVLKGIAFEKEKAVTNLEQYMHAGSWEKIENGIILGRMLARMLNASLGDRVLVIAPDSIGLPIPSIPRMKALEVVGIFESGMYEYDANMAYTGIKTSQDIFMLGDGITGMGIRTRTISKAKQTSAGIEKLLGSDFWTQSWQDGNRNLFSALKLEKIMMFIILTLIILVASFNIISNLLLFSIEKIRDIGILAALGATKKNIYNIFILEGLFMGSIGVALGSFTGIALALALKKYQFVSLPHDVYFLDKLPAKIVAADIALVVLSAMVIVFLSTIYPAKKASDTDPIEAIRYG